MASRPSSSWPCRSCADRDADETARSLWSVVQSVWAPLPLGALSFVALLPMTHASLDDPPGFVPSPSLVIAYAIPFGFGWLLFGNVDLLDTLRRRGWLYTAIAAR